MGYFFPSFFLHLDFIYFLHNSFLPITSRLFFPGYYTPEGLFFSHLFFYTWILFIFSNSFLPTSGLFFPGYYTPEGLFFFPTFFFYTWIFLFFSNSLLTTTAVLGSFSQITTRFYLFFYFF